MSLVMTAFSLSMSFLLIMLHMDEGNGLFTMMGLEWLYVTYKFYFEPIYSSLPPMVYFVGMVVAMTFGPLIFGAVAVGKKLVPAKT